MIRPARLSAAVALVGAVLSTQLEAQTTGQALTAADQEAQAMGLQVAFACSPRRHGEATGTTSTIRRESDALAGTAVYFRSIEGTFVALEEYDAELNGHCLVFAWWGDDLAPGTYRVGRLAMTAMEEEETSGEHSFYAWGAVRTPGENIMIVVESGSLTLESIEPGRFSGSFEIDGFAVVGSERGSAVRWAGSFSGIEGEPL